MSREKYQPRSDAEDAAKWRELMAYFWNWPHSPYRDMELDYLAREVREIRDREPSLLLLVAATREHLVRVYLDNPATTSALATYAEKLATNPKPFVSEYENTTPIQRLRMKPARRREIWLHDRAEIARIWFDGDEERAGEALDALPYSSIPDWGDLDHLLRTLLSSPIAPVFPEE